MSDPHEILRLIGRLNPRNNLYSYKLFHPEVSEMDVAHALGTCKIPQSALLGRTKWARQEGFTDQLVFNVHSVWCGQHLDYRTPKAMIGQDMLRKLATPAYAEFEGNWRCPICWGRDAVKVGDKVINCSLCGGSGVRSPKEVRPQYGNPWDQIYKDYLELLDRWEGHLTTIMCKHFRYIADEIDTNQAFFTKLELKAG